MLLADSSPLTDAAADEGPSCSASSMAVALEYAKLAYQLCAVAIASGVGWRRLKASELRALLISLVSSLASAQPRRL